jgi:hypothetical protein
MLLMSNPGFGFDAYPTSNTYINPNTLLSGDGYATFLLGAVVPNNAGADWWDGGTTSMPVNIYPTTVSRFYGIYINDDWKISRDLTLNLGLRYEYEGPYSEAENRLTRAPDLTSPIPELQGLQMPDVVKQYYDGSWILNGAFQFTDSDHRSSWNGGKGSLSPRVGFAYRLNDKTALRAAYGRYVTPWAKNSNENQLEAYYYGFANVTGAPAAIQGVPQMNLQDPFPASYPIQPSYGKSLGRYTMLGDSFTFPIGDRPRSNSDRLNISVQRQLPGGIVLDVTYFRNWTSQVFDTTYNINQVDPRIWYQYKDQTNQTVPNPFYNLLPVEKFPGQLRYRETLSITELMKPYPQYGDLRVIDGVNGGAMRYQALQIKAQRNFRNGFAGMIGYSYHREVDQRFYDDVANYVKQWSWQDSYFPRHRFTSSYTWELPFGKGRAFMSAAPRLLDAIAGGWSFSGMLYWRSGNLLNFGGMLANGDPVISNPTPQKWFDTSVFQRLPDYTQRTNPWFYPGLRGPGEFNLDTSLVKAFHITEKLRAQLRMDAFNALNGLTWSDPSTDVDSSTFGQCTSPLFYTFGRRVQLGFRMEF